MIYEEAYYLIIIKQISKMEKVSKVEVMNYLDKEIALWTDQRVATKSRQSPLSFTGSINWRHYYRRSVAHIRIMAFTHSTCKRRQRRRMEPMDQSLDCGRKQAWRCIEQVPLSFWSCEYERNGDLYPAFISRWL
jgi:hypothetical protein